MFLIKYIPNQSWRTVPEKIKGYKDQIILSGNNWDDYGSKTSFNMRVVLNDKEYTNWAVRVQIEEESYSSDFLDKLCDQGWDGIFPIPNKNYISQFSEIDFYKTLISVLGKEEAAEILKKFKDASYMVNIERDEKSLELIKIPVFNESLLRDTSSHKAYEEAWELFVEGVSSKIEDFQLNFFDKSNVVKNINFSFSKKLLPTDINVLIGPNGIGKSYTIMILMEYLLKLGRGDIKEIEKKDFQPFDKRPNFSNLILTSYSVFEDFLVDLNNEKIKDNEKENYKYFGLRTRDESNKERIGIGKNIPSIDAAKAVFKMSFDNYQFQDLSWWVNKLDLAKKTLKKAFDFDEFAIEFSSEIDSLLGCNFSIINDKKYLIINNKLQKFPQYIRNYNAGVPILFLKNDNIVQLSSGQKIFSYIVLNILGEIKQGSLIVIDEPELFLHPALEIEFITLLKEILEPFESKAILATHSLSIVREVPSSCVHIYREDEFGLTVENPPFQTFGGDMQRISTYVFGDTMLKKPYENFLKKLLDERIYTPAELIQALGNEANEEMIMDIKIWESINGN
ncbi:TPA: ATP-binding protein [Acinetobacter baumannii]|nr:ATP-binding protein [Acinetobacter baumannii]HAV5030234.1 ATP-binding protein [Acinetobacter baumannii]